MASCPGVVLKDGRYYFQARIPDECLPQWQRATGKNGPVYSVRLSAQTRKAACREVLETHWPKHHAMLDRLRAGPRTTLPEDEADRIVATALHSRLSADEDARLHGIAADEAVRQARWLEHLQSALAANAARGDLTGVAEIASDWLQEYQIDRTSVQFRAFVRKFARAMDQANKIIRERDAGSFVDSPPAPPVSPPVVAAATAGPTLIECQGRWERAKKRPNSTHRAASAAVRDFVAFHGAPRAVLGYSRKEVIAWRDSLLYAEEGALHQKTVNKKLSLLRAIVGTAIRDELAGLDENARNPFRDTEVDEPRGAKPRIGYSAAQLSALFTSPVFADGERPDAGRGEAAFWLPVLALYSGARLEELGQLRVSDVGEEGGIPFLHLTPDAGRIKSQKERRVPLHPKVRALGFLGYVETMRKAGTERLFPALRKGSKGQWTESWGKWYGKYLRRVVQITDTRITFHSFRHTFKDACREAGIDGEVQDAILGHAGSGEGRNYGNGLYPLRPLAGAMERIEYTGATINASRPWAN